MSIKTYVTSIKPEQTGNVEVDGTEYLDVLGENETKLSVQLKELFESVMEAVTPTIQTESKLTVEISGEVNLKAEGGVKYLFFNVGGEIGSKGAMKVTLSTTLTPKEQ